MRKIQFSSRRFIFAKVLVGIFAILLMTQCHPRTVTRNGVVMSYEEAARLDLTDAEKLLAAGKKTKGIAALRGIIERYPDSKLRDDIESRLGDIFITDGNFKEAAPHYEEIVEHHIFSPFRNRALYRLGVCHFQEQKYREAINTLQPLVSRMNGDSEKAELNFLLSTSYEKLERNDQALPFWVNIVDVYEKGSLGTKIQTPFAKITPKEEIKQKIIDTLTKAHEEKDLDLLKRAASDYEKRFPGQYALYFLADLLAAQDNKSGATASVRSLETYFPEDPLTKDGLRIGRRLESQGLVNAEKIGVLLPLSGRNARFGEECLEGIELAASLMSDTNQNSNFQFVIRDTGDDAKAAADALQSLVLEDQVIGVIGPLLSGQSVAAAQEAEGMQVPMVSLASAAGLPELGSYIFRASVLRKEEVKAILDYAYRELKKKGIDRPRFAILYPTSSYGISMRDFFWNEVNQRNGEVTAAETYRPGEKDFKEEVQKLVGLYYKEPRQPEWDQLARENRNKGKRVRKQPFIEPTVDFDAIFIPDVYTTATIIADYLPYFDVKNVMLLGDSNWNNPALLTRSPRNVQGAVFTDGFFPESARSNVTSFITNFRSFFDAEPRRHAAFAFDTAEMLIKILQNRNVRTRSDLRNALSQVQNFQGVTGSIHADASGELARAPFLLRVENQNIVEVTSGQN